MKLFGFQLLVIYITINTVVISQNKKNNYLEVSTEASNEVSYIDDFEESSHFYPIDNAISNDNTFVVSQSKLGKFTPLTGNLAQLQYFFRALKNIKNKKVRIAHYGDSIIMGDIITENIRKNYQQNYSGKGVGFVSIISDDFRMRRTILQSYSNDWEYASFVTRNSEHLPYGINGSVAVPKRGSWVKFETTQFYKSIQSFDNVKIYYSNAGKNSVIEYFLDNSTSQKINLSEGDEVQEIIIQAKDSKKFELRFLGGKQPFFYGVNFDSDYGIYVDNFSMRGNTGISLLDINPKTLHEFNKFLDYDLIIFNYGANVSSPNKGIYTLYENKMVSVIEEFKKIFPSTSFLLVSVADKTTKRGSEFITNSDVPLLLEAQKTIVQKTNIAFWNLWDAMGGNNSMNTWVNAVPPQALKDYAHFTPDGGIRVGELLYMAIQDAFDKAK